MSEPASTPPNSVDPTPEQAASGEPPRKLVPICQPRAAIAQVAEPNPALDEIPLGQPTKGAEEDDYDYSHIDHATD